MSRSIKKVTKELKNNFKSFEKDLKSTKPKNKIINFSCKNKKKMAESKVTKLSPQSFKLVLIFSQNRLKKLQTSILGTFNN